MSCKGSRKDTLVKLHARQVELSGYPQVCKAAKAWVGFGLFWVALGLRCMGIGLFWNGLDLVWAGVALLRANNRLLKWATVWLRYVSGANAYEIPLFRRYVSV